MPAISSFKNHQIHCVWQQTTEQLRDQLIAFWQDNGAIQDPFEAWRRTFEVACVALNTEGQIVGVGSAYSTWVPALNAPYWCYRTFVREDSREVGLAPRIFARTYEQLALTNAGETHAPVGMLVIAENPKLATAGGIRVIKSVGFQYLGVDDNGQGVWHQRFKP